MLLDGSMVIGRTQSAITGCLRDGGEIIRYSLVRRLGPRVLDSTCAADAMEPEKRKTGVEESLLESDYAGLEMAQRWPAFARKCLSVQFAVLGSVPMGAKVLKVLKVGECSRKEHDFVRLRW